MTTKRLGAAAILLLASTGIAAQTQTAAPSVSGETGLFHVLTGNTLPKGTWSGGAFYESQARLVTEISCLLPPLTSDWGYDHERLSASVGYGISDNFEISLMLPVVERLRGDGQDVIGTINGTEFVNTIDGDGVGNLRLGAKWKVVESSDGRQSLAINAFVEAPTGDDKEGVVTGETGWGLGLGYSVGRVAFSLGYRDPGQPSKGHSDATPLSEHEDYVIPVSKELIAGVGVAVPINDSFDWISEMVATMHPGSESPAAPDSYDLVSGGRYYFGSENQWALNFAIEFELKSYDVNGPDTSPWGGLVGITYAPRLPAFGDKAQAPDTATTGAADRDRDRDRDAADAAAPATPPGADRDDPSRDQDRGSVTGTESRPGTTTPEAGTTPTPPTPTSPAPPARPAPGAEQRETVHFDPNSARLSNIAKAKLDEVALRMQQDPDIRALILGYTDSTGSPEANQRLSLQRAEAVRAYLVERHGIEASRIDVEGRGSSDPVASNETAEGRAQNRRAVIVLQIR